MAQVHASSFTRRGAIALLVLLAVGALVSWSDFVIRFPECDPDCRAVTAMFEPAPAR